VTGDNWVTVAQVIGGLMGAGGLGALGRALLKRRPGRVAASVRLNQSTLDWADKLEASADRAWRRAEEAERKAEDADQRADQAERTARRVQAQVNELARYLEVVLRLINDPDMTMDRLRASVGDGPAHLT
jgi:hypothetical protein